MRRWLVALAAPVMATGPAVPGAVAASPHEPIVVTSFEFPESVLLAEIYAQALEDEGYPVERELDLGPRELVVPALRQGFVDVVPEYVGSALDAAAPESTVDRTDTEAVTSELRRVVAPWGADVLTPSEASNHNAVVVTADTASAHDLTAISDLAALAPGFDLGGPPECPRRRYCQRGLEDTYGLEFASFVPLADQALVQRALAEGVVDVGVLFTTDAALAEAGVVVLADDRSLQPAENVVPLVRRAALDDGAVDVLNDVSAALTTTSLRFLNWRVAHAGRGAAAEARGWLLRHGLVLR